MDLAFGPSSVSWNQRKDKYDINEFFRTTSQPINISACRWVKEKQIDRLGDFETQRIKTFFKFFEQSMSIRFWANSHFIWKLLPFSSQRDWSISCSIWTSSWAEPYIIIQWIRLDFWLEPFIKRLGPNRWRYPDISMQRTHFRLTLLNIFRQAIFRRDLIYDSWIRRNVGSRRFNNTESKRNPIGHFSKKNKP